MAAKLKKKNQLTKKNEEKMKKLMFILNVTISAIFASSIFTYTIGSLIKAGWQGYHIAFIALCMLAILLVKSSVRELIAELKK